MSADDEPDPLDRWLSEPVRLLHPADGAFESIAKRAHRRRVRRTVTLASSVVVVAAVAVGVPLGLVQRLGLSPGQGNQVAASSTASHTAAPSGTAAPGPSRSASPAASSGAAASPNPLSTGGVPGNFAASSVTWVSTNDGWVIGQAGTPGHCANGDPDNCTSVAYTTDGGKTWHGQSAPDTSGPDGAQGVSELRFYNGTDGWAFGPALWSTHDGGASWQQVNTGGQLVTDLETVDGRAYALFATCASPQTAWSDGVAHGCSSFTLETTTAGADAWTDVAGVPATMPVPAGGGTGVIELSGTTGYLITPDDTLYSGPVSGGTWSEVAALPCTSAVYQNNALAHPVLLATAGLTSSGATRLALVCGQQTSSGYASVSYISDDDGANWTVQSQLGTNGSALLGAPQSLAATSSGTLILGTGSGIRLLPLDGTQWQTAGVASPPPAKYGFSYVGMTTASQGVALSADPDTYNEIWMTTDGGQTWNPVSVTG